MYPRNDDQFRETTITKVQGKRSEGWSIECADGWSISVPENSPILPKKGMKARFYGKEIGFFVRGMFLNGVKVWYRTEAGEHDFRETERYGADASDWLKRWDDGKTVWSVEMGGLGPSYEQCIQITVAEILRHMLALKYDVSKWGDDATIKQDCEAIEGAVLKNGGIKRLSLSGGQLGAATNLAMRIYRDGPRKVLGDDRIKERLIQVQRTFPVLKWARTLTKKKTITMRRGGQRITERGISTPV